MKLGEFATPARKGVGVVHPGTQHSWQTALALQERNDLAWYATSIFYVQDRWPYKIERYLPAYVKALTTKEFERFYDPRLEPKLVYTFGATQWAMRVAARLGWRRIANYLMYRNNSSIARPTARLMRSKPVRAIWAYDLCALETFQFARERGIDTVLDRTIGHPKAYNRIMEEVYAEFPEFCLKKEFRIAQELLDRADAEHELADLILVGSKFCKDTLDGVLSADEITRKVRTVPYCYDERLFQAPQRRARNPHDPIRFLFIGQAGPRKGIHLVLKVFERIPKSAASLTIVGDLQIPTETFARYADRVTLTRTVSRADVPRIMAEADCLLLPSYFEGAALSVAEAYATGLAVIQSRNTGMAEYSADLVIETQSVLELERCVNTVLEDPRILTKAAESAHIISNTFSFESYMKRVSRVVSELRL